MDNYLAEIVILLALVVLVLVVAVFALARQIGVLHTRLAPAGALMTTAGPKVGEPAPLLSIPDPEWQPDGVGRSAQATAAPPICVTHLSGLQGTGTNSQIHGQK